MHTRACLCDMHSSYYFNPNIEEKTVHTKLDRRQNQIKVCFNHS